MEKVVLSENELAQHWGVSPKTLQRWRSEGRGPPSSTDFSRIRSIPEPYILADQ